MVSKFKQENTEIKKSRFFKAVEEDDYKLVKKLSKTIDVNIKNARGFTALHYASFNVAKLLIKEGADVNSVSYFSQTTPLSRAFKNCEVQLVQLYSEHNAKLHISQKEFFDFLDDFKYNSVLKIILNNPFYNNYFKLVSSSYENLLIQATITKNDEMVNYLIEKGMDVNSDNNYGKSALFFSSPEISKLLIEKGADVNKKDYIGKTALFYVGLFNEGKNELDKLKLLLEKGANPNLSDNYGMLPIEYYISKYKPSSHERSINKIKLLMEYKAKTDENILAFLESVSP